MRLRSSFAALAACAAVFASAAPSCVDITAYGAVGDNATINTASIAAAMAAASALATFDAPVTVCVPSGVFRTGTVNLTSNVYLGLSPGAVLQASSSWTDYSDDWDYWHVVQGVNVSNSGVVSTMPPGLEPRGAIVGNMWQMIDHWDDAQRMYVPAPWTGVHGCEGECRVKNLAFIDSVNLTITGVDLNASSDWSSLYRRVANVTIRDVRIDGSRAWPNGDGMDVESGSDIVVVEVVISTGDDAIALRSGNCNTMRTPWPEPWGHISPLTRVTIANSTLSSSSAAVKVEGLFQLDHGNVTDIVLRNVSITDSNRGIGVWQRIGSGVIANISVEDVRIDTHFMWGSDWWGSGEPIVITSVPENLNQSRYGLAGIHNVTFNRVTATGTNGMLMSSRDQGDTNPTAVTGIVLSDVNFTLLPYDPAVSNAYPQHDYRPTDPGAATPNTIPANVTGMYVEHVTSLTLDNVAITFSRPNETFWTHVCVAGTADSNITYTGAWQCTP